MRVVDFVIISGDLPHPFFLQKFKPLTETLKTVISKRRNIASESDFLDSNGAEDSQMKYGRR